REERLPFSFVPIATHLEDIAAVRHCQGALCILLDEQNRGPPLIDLLDSLEDHRNELRCESGTRFIDEENRRVQDEGLSEGNHLLLPPAERAGQLRSEEHTSELQSRFDLVCRLLLEKKKAQYHK